MWAKMVNKPCLWEYSSAKVLCGMNKYDELGVNKIFSYIEHDQKGWKRFIELSDNPDETKQIRESTRKGRPLGSNDFVEKLEKRRNRFLRLKPKGRPKKK